MFGVRGKNEKEFIFRAILFCKKGKSVVFMIDISICIPMYNSEKFVSKTLESLVKQTIINKEIIIINDGSTDRSAEIVKSYQKDYPYIKCFYQENSGISIARQTAANIATGRYITFLDADDSVEENIYDRMVSLADKNNYDIVECRSERCGRLYNDYPEGLFEGDKIIYDYFLKYEIKRPLWLRIYKRELVDESTFPHIRLNNEDVFVFPCLLARAKRYYIMPKDQVLHHYADDNSQSVVNLMKASDEKTYRKIMLFAKAPEHFKDTLSSENKGILNSEAFMVFCGRFYNQILTRKYINNSYDECMRDICDTSGANTEWIETCILTYYKNTSLIVYLFSRILGLKCLRKICMLYR